MSIIQVYAPTTDAKVEELMSFIVKFSLRLAEHPEQKKKELLVVGDWKTKTGNSKEKICNWTAWPGTQK